MENEFREFQEVMFALLSVAVHDAVNETRNRMLALKNPEPPEPEQLIIERAEKKLRAQLQRKMRPLLEEVLSAGIYDVSRWAKLKRLFSGRNDNGASVLAIREN